MSEEFPLAAAAIEAQKKKNLAIIRRKINAAAIALEEAAFLIRVHNPEGGVFIEGDGSINVVTNTDDTIRHRCVVADARFDKSLISVGAW